MLNTCAMCRNSWTSATWTAQKWIEYANHKPFPLSWGYRFEGAKMMTAEKRLARRFDVCTATTRAEWQTLEEYATGASTDWFPNGVDSDFFCPRTEPYDANTISFVGRIDYYPNQECMSRFCDHVWPLLRARRPAMKLLIVGAEPSSAMRRLGEPPWRHRHGVGARCTAIRAQISRDGRTVGHRPRNSKQNSGGYGYGGSPVVTSRVAAGGVDAEAGIHLVVADSPQEQVGGHHQAAGLASRAPETGARGPAANAQSPCLGTVDEAA